jgi:hypothetical protein
MKSILIFLVCAFTGLQLCAQSWKVQVQRVSGQQEKTLRIKPGINVTTGWQTIINDSLTEERYYDGIFNRGTKDSLELKLNKVRINKYYANGINEHLVIPGRNYLQTLALDTSFLKVPLNNIGFLEYRKEKLGGWAEIGEPIILASILVMIAAPLISYDFKKGELNENRYKNWALGGTIGVAGAFATIFTFSALSHHKKVQFNTGWPDKKAKAWQFK